MLLLLPLLRERSREARIVGARGAQLRLESLHGAVDVLQLRSQCRLLQRQQRCLWRLGLGTAGTTTSRLLRLRGCGCGERRYRRPAPVPEQLGVDARTHSRRECRRDLLDDAVGVPHGSVALLACVPGLGAQGGDLLVLQSRGREGEGRGVSRLSP